MGICNKDGFGKSLTVAMGKKGLFLALALAGAGFQGCTTEDKATGPLGGADAEGAASGQARLAAFVVDPATQASDEKKAELLSAAPKDTVVTPFGKVERRCVEKLGPGEVLQDESTIVSGNGLRKVADEQGCGILGGDTGMALNPLGKASAAKDGWVMAGWWNLPFLGHEMWSDLTVPREPAKQGSQLIFMFSSLNLPGNSGWIVQPVLQWGENGDLGGKYWTMACWIVKGPGTKSYMSNLMPVYPGDKLWGYMHATNCHSDGQCTWTIDMLDLTRHTSTELKSDVRLPAMKYAEGGVMETYHLAHCDEYPAQSSVAFTSISVFNDKPTWRTSDWYESLYSTSPSCHFNVTWTNSTSSSVTLHWNPGT